MFYGLVPLKSEMVHSSQIIVVTDHCHSIYPKYHLAIQTDRLFGPNISALDEKLDITMRDLGIYRTEVVLRFVQVRV